MDKKTKIIVENSMAKDNRPFDEDIIERNQKVNDRRELMDFLQLTKDDDFLSTNRSLEKELPGYNFLT